MQKTIIILLISTIAVVIIKYLDILITTKLYIKNINFRFGYTPKKYLFTKTELQFYKQLTSILDKNNCNVFSKVRLIDLFEVKNNNNKNNTYLNKIKAKHIDFIITKNNGEILFGIELDDKTHNSKSAIRNDGFKNQLFNTFGIKLFRYNVSNIYDFNELIQYLNNNLNNMTNI